jgi:hypothetical protein
MAVQTAQPAEKVPKARPEKMPQPRQPTRRPSHHPLSPSPPRAWDSTQQSLKLRGKRLLCAAQPTAHPPHTRAAALPRGFGARAGTLRGQARLDGLKPQIAVRADILRQHRMADLATRASHTAQQLPLSAQIAPIPAMTPKGSPLTIRVRTAQRGDRTAAHLLSILLAAQTSNAYHGLLSEARRVSFPVRQDSRSARRASLVLPI